MQKASAIIALNFAQCTKEMALSEKPVSSFLTQYVEEVYIRPPSIIPAIFYPLIQLVLKLCQFNTQTIHL